MFSLDSRNTRPKLDTSARATRRRRRNFANTNALSEYEADLTHEDRTKQKEAVRKYLAEKVRNDWSFQWPSYPQTSVSSQASSLSDVDMTCDLPEEQEWKEREEWFSDLALETGDDEQDSSVLASSPGAALNNLNCSENSLKKNKRNYRRKQKEELKEELGYNDGLRCFTARRDAWTGARVVHKAVPASSNNLSHDQSIRQNSEDQTVRDDEYESEEILVPIGRLLLPPENFVRSSIKPHSYNFIYDKVVLNSITPACPINLKDMIQSCVQGWKRDGQWPPPSIELANKPSRRQSNRQALSNLFPNDTPDNLLDEATDRGGNEGNKRESIGEQGQKQRGRAREKKSHDFRDRNKGLNSYFNRILGRGL